MPIKMLLLLTKLTTIQTYWRKKMQGKTSDDKRMPFIISKVFQVPAIYGGRGWGMTISY